jgi:hypothetical protein
MANIVQLKRSSVADKIPDSANIAVGEPVVNLTDKILYTKNGSDAIIVIGAGTTSNIAEGVNLYFTNARARLAVSEGSGVSYDNSTGVISANVTSVNGFTGAVTGLATTSAGLSQFDPTTSADLAAVISDETGSGALVFATSPTLVTPILGTPQSGTLTNCSFPTLNQNTTGSAATLTTPRAINGVDFDGSSAITVPGNFADRTTNESGHAVFISTSATGNQSMFTNTNYRFNPSTAEVSATSFNSTSDFNKKKDIETIVDALDIVKHLRGVTYNWKDTDRPGIGVIAQEVELYLPQVVVESDNESKTVQYGNMVGLLIEAIKQQQKQIEQMKSSITILLDKIYTKGKGK